LPKGKVSRVGTLGYDPRINPKKKKEKELCLGGRGRVEVGAR